MGKSDRLEVQVNLVLEMPFASIAGIEEAFKRAVLQDVAVCV